jgi:small subunit ribosomal protein S13
MVRIVGINIPEHEHVVIGLQRIFGIGATRAKSVCESVGVTCSTKIKDLTDENLAAIRTELAKFTIEGDLRRKVSLSIKRLVDIKCYRGRRHVLGLPVRGQRTRTNARTRRAKKR